MARPLPKITRRMTKASVKPIPGAVLKILDWLSSEECRALDNISFVAGLGETLRLAGLPIDRLAFHVGLPHPELVGRTCAWAPGEAVEIKERKHGFLESDAFLGSPLRRVMETGKSLHTRHDKQGQTIWTHLDVYQGRGLVDHFILPLGNSEGPSAVAFCTASPHGFSATQIAVIEHFLPLLRSISELRILRQAESILLDTYIGSATARRILAGNIQRGQVETLEAALMLCDLRGFTELSNRLPSARILQVLDSYFDRVVPAITGAGGEILKFMGDAVLAFFSQGEAKTSAAAAMNAALSALHRLACVDLPDAKMQAGIALHYGEVSYGNIGAGNRLDFTVIGQDVNLVSRIQGECSVTGHPLLMSWGFAGLLDGISTMSIGRRRLKGFSDPVELFGLRHPVDSEVTVPRHLPDGTLRQRFPNVVRQRTDYLRFDDAQPLIKAFDPAVKATRN